MEAEKCKQCGSQLDEEAKFCYECGTFINKDQKNEPGDDNTVKAANESESQPEAAEAADTQIAEISDDEHKNQNQQSDISNQSHQKYQYGIPGEQYNPYTESKHATVGTWSFVGLMIVFFLPFIGFILAIVWSFDSTNITRRNFARAVLFLKIIAIILSVVIFVLGFMMLYDAISEFINTFRNNGFTIPFDQYDINIGSYISSVNKIVFEKGALNYRYFDDISTLYYVFM